jgi:hypothetical protein
MTREEIVERFSCGQMTGSDLLALPHNSNLNDVGRVLVELYYALIDTNEARVLADEPSTISPERFRERTNYARIHTDTLIADTLKYEWFEEE